MIANQRRLEPAETAVLARPLPGAAVMTDAPGMTPYVRGKAACLNPARSRRDQHAIRVDGQTVVRQGGMRR
jgi:hypothetical protein